MQSPDTAPGFHHVAIRAIDFDETIRFYTEGLGFGVRYRFSVPGRIDRAAFLDAGDGRCIEVFGQDSIVQSEGRRRQPHEEPTEGALLHFCLRVTDTPAAYRKALAAGAVSRVEPVIRQLGQDPLVEVHIAFVTGPNGEVIEFLHSDQL
ncbi:VOC family protein [Rhodopila sp.]|jgi:catechol 2,3-dioxygenase-like lactoylglutathione lyase family enzyme|uniref:VOC family protein n=1 Tax=Rhodopila sp. TaxID=2480087 RepID=UPI002C2C09D0|nr:VOC family protein [Rhodopila sp.]HVZ07722.1 VOC family protein [Rhodopila sp.]